MLQIAIITIDRQSCAWANDVLEKGNISAICNVTIEKHSEIYCTLNGYKFECASFQQNANKHGDGW